jgi:hypothetical protein
MNRHELACMNRFRARNAAPSGRHRAEALTQRTASLGIPKRQLGHLN